MGGVLKFKPFISSNALLLCSTGLLISGCGLVNTLISLYLKYSGDSVFTIGWIAAAYFAGLFLGSLKTSFLISHVGFVKSFSTLAAVLAISVLMPGMKYNIPLWFVCRFIQGFSLAGLYVVIESWILASANDEVRGRSLAIYMIVLYGTYALGQLVINSVTVISIIPFCIACILIVSSIIPISIFPVIPPVLEENEPTNIMKIYKSCPFGLIACFIAGMLISAIFSILPVYIESVVQDSSHISFAMALVFLSGMFIQYPLGIISDKIGRNRLLILLCLVFLIFFGILAVAQYYVSVTFSYLICIIIILGVFSFSLYPLSMNMICDNLKTKEILAATEVICIVYGLGSIFGPPYFALFMKYFESFGYLISNLSLVILLGIFAIFLMKKATKHKTIAIGEMITPLIPYNQFDIENISSGNNNQKN